MVTTFVPQFEGTPTLTEEKVETIKEWFAIAMGDADKADDTDDLTYYQSYAEAYEIVLKLLYDVKEESDV